MDVFEQFLVLLVCFFGHSIGTRCLILFMKSIFAIMHNAVKMHYNKYRIHKQNCTSRSKIKRKSNRKVPEDVVPEDVRSSSAKSKNMTNARIIVASTWRTESQKGVKPGNPQKAYNIAFYKVLK